MPENSPVTPVGIDLGTSFCAVSYIDADGSSQMIRGADGQILTPSVVHFGDDQIAVGSAAVEAMIRAPARAAENVKRDMGLASYRRPINGQEFPPEVIQSCILRQLRRHIVEQIGENFQAVITVPAYFDEPRRKATLDAAFMSGLPVLDIVNEPTAAALSFGERLGYLTPDGAPQQRMNVLVYDLGGGTFDVSVIRLAADEIRTLATDGDYQLGGENWDDRLACHLEVQFQARWPDAAPASPVEEILLRRLARDAKHSLTDRPLAVIDISRDSKTFKASVTREEFENLTEDLLARTLFTVRQTLQAAKIIWSEVDRLLLVGGSSRMPAVARQLTETSGLPVETAVNPDEAVARGAAVYARYLMAQRHAEAPPPKLRITDVNSHSLGLEGVNLETLQTQNVSLIPRNTPLPCDVKRTFMTRSDNQPSVKIQLLEGESSLPTHCSPLATATIRNLPPGLPKGTPVEVNYSLQSNGRLAVSAAVPGHGADAVIELQRTRGLNDRRVHVWQKIVCRDGGYRDYQDALLQFFEPDADEHEDDDLFAAPAASGRAQELNLEPAYDYGAPQAAAEALHYELQESARRSSNRYADAASHRETAVELDHQTNWPTVSRRGPQRTKPLTYFIGHIVFGLLGIFLGYFLLTLIRPDLKLRESQRPESPSANRSAD